ncbi:MAG: aliphatic sulfonate ABC transporter substrate-binding protein [Helicobacteraceae bacterium]|jgi:sulfonate transport system substrate-binding protein|nr:aliphatic sulfonate ABC transporter substrate-binding protein [Helicobacteraceae bacterium]
MKGAFIARFAAIAIALFAFELFAAQKPTLRIAAQQTPAYASLWVAKELGWFDEEFKKVGATYTWNVFSAGPLVNEALSADGADLGVSGDQPAITARSAGLDVIVVANLGSGERTIGLIAPPNSSLKTVKDFKGKKIAYGKGSTVHHLLDLLLKENGLSKSDVEHINLGAEDIGAALDRGDVDGALTWDHTLTKLISEGRARLIADGSGIKLTNRVNYVTRSFAEKHPEVIAAYIRAIDRGAQWIEGDNKDEAYKLLAPIFKLDRDTFSKVFANQKLYTKFSKRDLDEIRSVKDYLLKERLIRNDIDIDKFITTKYIEAAGI